jgi:hypothetical protein
VSVGIPWSYWCPYDFSTFIGVRRTSLELLVYRIVLELLVSRIALELLVSVGFPKSCLQDFPRVIGV